LKLEGSCVGDSRPEHVLIGWNELELKFIKTICHFIIRFCIAINFNRKLRFIYLCYSVSVFEITLISIILE
jgi:hypothetical protein